MTRTIDHSVGKPLLLDDQGGLRRCHVFEQEDLDALRFAIAAGRPLLLRGEPGTGKSQIAEAAATALRCPFVARTVDSRTEARDLHYEVDFVLRLAEAQLEGAIHGANLPELRQKLALPNFTRPGPLWWAFDWHSAAKLPLATPPDQPKGWKPGQGCVVLLDEIDKAEADLPNGLLEALGHGRFVDPVGNTIAITGEPPLVVVTSNEERELPDAFVRRCLVHTLRLPAVAEAFTEFVSQRGKAHFPEMDEGIVRDAASMLWEDRQACTAAKPGLAEFLDVLRALHELTNDSARKDALAKVRAYTYRKFGSVSRTESKGAEAS